MDHILKVVKFWKEATISSIQIWLLHKLRNFNLYEGNPNQKKKENQVVKSIVYFYSYVKQ